MLMEELKIKLNEICNIVSLDEATKSEAWKKFVAASEQFVLEGDKVSWLVCSLYATCCLEEIETVDGHTTLGNFMSLAKMLQVSNISLYNFFSRLHQWCEMVAAPTGFSAHVHRLEQRFIVSSVVFGKYRSIFSYVFGNVDLSSTQIESGDTKDSPSSHVDKPMSPPSKRSRKTKSLPCSASDLFEFGWCVFLLVKAQYRQISDNLLNCYHLALSCVDWLYSVAVQSQRQDLVSEQFKEDLSNTSSSSFGPATRQAAAKPPSIIHVLCQRFSGVEVEALAIRQYHWQPALKKFNESKMVIAGSDHGIIDHDVFIENKKSIQNSYDEYILRTGDFDERVLMAPDAHSRIGSPPKTGLNSGHIMSPANLPVEAAKSERGMFPPPKPVVGAHLGAARKLMPMFGRPTPLTARERLGPPSFVPSTPVGAAATTAAYLLQLATPRQQGMSEALQQLLDKSGKKHSVEFERLTYEYKSMLEKALASATNTGEDTTSSAAHTGASRVVLMSTSLFYRCAELLLAKERHILVLKTGNAEADIAPVAVQITFLKSLFAVSSEIILSAFCPACSFPWGLTAFKLAPHDLLRVIEPLVRADDHLPRETIKHLNYIEESILEYYLWKSDSTFWRLLDNSEIPSYEEVCLEKDHQTGQVAPSPSVQTPANTPLRAAMTSTSLTPNLTRVFNGSQTSTQGTSSVTTSPTAASSSVCRALFAGEDEPKVDRSLSARSVAVASPSRIAPELPISITSKTQSTKPESISRKSGPVALIFRKLYRMIALRLSELCNSLGLGSRFLQLAFTFMEHCFISDIALLRDRHVDQILLCAIYMMSKVLQKQIVSFSELLKWYRKLPHANSATYRCVLLHPNPPNTPEKSIAPSEKESPASSTRSSTRQAAKRRKTEEKEEPEAKSNPTVITLAAEISLSEVVSPPSDNRGDIVLFYNVLFVPKFQDYAVELGEGRRSGSTIPNARFAKLSPLPCRRSNSGAMLSPRHLSTQVSIQPLDTSPARLNIMNSSDRLMVQVNSSPNKELQAINSALKHRATMSATRRLLGDVDSMPSSNSNQNGQSSSTSTSARQLLDSLGA